MEFSVIVWRAVFDVVFGGRGGGVVAEGLGEGGGVPIDAGEVAGACLGRLFRRVGLGRL